MNVLATHLFGGGCSKGEVRSSAVEGSEIVAMLVCVSLSSEEVTAFAAAEFTALASFAATRSSFAGSSPPHCDES